MSTTFIAKCSLRKLHLFVESIKELDERAGFDWSYAGGHGHYFSTIERSWKLVINVRSADKATILDWFVHRLSTLASEDSVDSAICFAAQKHNIRFLTEGSVHESIKWIKLYLPIPV
jgi:hypothetical protein